MNCSGDPSTRKLLGFGHEVYTSLADEMLTLGIDGLTSQLNFYHKWRATHSQIYRNHIYIYIHMCVCVCVSVSGESSPFPLWGGGVPTPCRYPLKY